MAVLGMVNASLSSVAERRGEIGLLRTVGAIQRQVIGLLLAKAGILGETAAVLGVIVGWAATLPFLAVAGGTLLSGAAASSPGARRPLLAAGLTASVL